MARQALVIVLAAVTAVAAEPRFPAALVDALDAAVQRRLADPAAKRFGITRVGDRHRAEFTPETPAEERLVTDLKAGGWNVSVYLAGRGLLVTDRRPSAVQGPVVVTSGDAPPGYAMQYEARTAFRLLAVRETHEFSVGRWSVVARPVRASAERCVTCHNRSSGSFGLDDAEVKMGDLLGVALYAFAPASSMLETAAHRVTVPTVALSGRVIGVAPEVLSKVRFTLARLGDTAGSRADRLVDVRPAFSADGTFTTMVPEGAFQLHVVGMPDTHRVWALTYGDVNLLEEPMIVGPGAVAPLLVRLAPNVLSGLDAR